MIVKLAKYVCSSALVLTKDNVTIYVLCHDQSDGWSLNPEWCINYWQNFDFKQVVN